MIPDIAKCLSRSKIALSWDTTLESLLATKPFHLLPFSFSFHFHYHQVSLVASSHSLSPFPHHSISPESGCWHHSLPKILSEDQSDLLAAKSSKWPFLSSLICCNTWHCSFIFMVSVLMYSFGSIPISLFPLDPLSTIVSKSGNSPLCRPQLCSSQFSSLLMSLLVTAM